MSDDPRAQILATFKDDRATAHEVLFAHRHPNVSPDFHRDLIHDWGSDEVGVLQMVFRGGAKSTIAEEGLLLGACFKEFRYALIVAYNIDKACQRLHSIRHEAETNTALQRLFGNLQGAIWSVDQLLFANGVMIQALGKGMSLRGCKHLDMRPDYLLGDDLEDRVDVRNEDRMNATWQWFSFDLIPALAQGEYRARVLATPMHPDSLPMRIEREGEWTVRKVPVYHPDPITGERVSSWDDRFPLTIEEAERRRFAVYAGIKDGSLPKDTRVPRKQDSIEHIEERANRGGSLREFQCEYLCISESPEEKPFKREMIRIVPQYQAWQAVNVMFDPARTTNTKSARTGFAAWSWIGEKLVVWESWGKLLKPDEIIEAIFQAGGAEPGSYMDENDVLHPYPRFCGPFDTLVHLGVEEDGLNDWLLQPIRHQQRRRGIILPLRPMRAPRGKTDFIRSLQQYYNAREVEHASPQNDLEQELLAFPHATRMDVPNALAYAILMRRGRPIYADFRADNVREGLKPTASAPAWLAMNAVGAITTGVLCQLVDGAFRVFADWVKEGQIAENAPRIVTEAKMSLGPGVELRFTAPPVHFERYQNVGLAQAILPDKLEKGADPLQYSQGRATLRDLLQREVRGMPGVMISDKARWTAAAMAGGYAHVELKHGALADYAEEGPYRTLMEGVESLVGIGARSTRTDERPMNATTPQGIPYRSMLGGQARVMRRG